MDPRIEHGQRGPAAREPLDHLFTLAYNELRRLASSVRRDDPSVTLNTTALVHEAWLKLERSGEAGSTSRLHFKRIAARAMRQLLIEAARKRNAGKRGAGTAMSVSLDDSFGKAADPEEQVLALNSALDELARMHPRQAAIVESRFFGGLEVSEVAALLEISEATVLREWRAAKAWLAREVEKQ
ncbi:MAG: ECF-type sigma factor [Bryobacteraceae bacterium]